MLNIHLKATDELIHKHIRVTNEKVESHHSTIRNMEIQVSQMATLLSGQIEGSSPSNTEKNPKDHLKAISLRSGKNLNDLYEGK